MFFTNSPEDALARVVDSIRPKGVYVLTDTNAAHFVLPVLQSVSEVIASAPVVTVPSGDVNKTLESAQLAWTRLVELGATRHSVLSNVGGGVVTDLGGFVASTFKRGMHCVNVPPTLLGAVDAAVGGKTGVNFRDLKNQIGTFSLPDAVIVSTVFFNTLSDQELLSGYAEMIKHGLLSSQEAFDRLMAYRLDFSGADADSLLALLEESVKVKTSIVESDPCENGIRKALNLGHTAGHAIETLALRRQSPIPHGFAVAYGMVVECILSSMLQGFPSESLHRLADYVRHNYGIFAFDCKDYDALVAIMRQDKKNDSPEHINFTLLHRPGDPVIDVTVDVDHITGALDVYRDMMGL